MDTAQSSLKGILRRGLPSRWSFALDAMEKAPRCVRRAVQTALTRSGVPHRPVLVREAVSPLREKKGMVMTRPTTTPGASDSFFPTPSSATA